MSMIVFGGAAVVGHIAVERGRNRLPWTLGAIVTSSSIMWLAWVLLADNVRTYSERANVAAAGVTLGPAAAHVVLSMIVSRLPTPTGSRRARAWRVQWLAGAGAPDTTYRLELRRQVMVITASSDARSFVIARPRLSTVRADGDCIRLHWEDGDDEHSALLLPLDAAPASDGRARMSEAIARKIRRWGSPHAG